VPENHLFERYFIMERQAYQSLIEWKRGTSRKPLLVQGARQVGKTYLLREFGQREYADCAYFNFEETPALATLFAGDLTPPRIVESLSAYQSRPIRPGTTLLFLDEIQACPRALTGLKYFCEQAPEFHVAAAGSLLGVSVGKTSSFPVGKVSFLTLYPFSFIEFVKASGEEALYALLHDKTGFEAVPELLHDKLSTLLRSYLYVGGMPDAVKSYFATKDLSTTRAVQKELLKAYERDFSKYTTPTQAVRVSEIWRSIPAHLSREKKKFKYSTVRKGGRASQFESAVEWLRGAGLLFVSVNVTVSKLPLAGYEDHASFKAYLFDCGLLGAMTDLPAPTVVLGDRIFSEYNGALIENLVADELARKSDGILHFWMSKNLAEVDFLVVHDTTILPLEVKSGMHRNIKSLRVYAERFKPSRIYRSSPRNFECRGDFANIPLYAIGLFPELR
jgi:predicted AAA+ superfamily ATPase